MKKSFLIAVAVLCTVVIFSSQVKPKMNAVNAQKSTKTVCTELDKTDTVLLSMLNHNFVYGSDFDSADVIVNRSLKALSVLRDTSGNYVKVSYVTDFVNNMYGVEIIDLSNYNAAYPEKEGYLFTDNSDSRSYIHGNIKTILNEDGTITAETDVKITEAGGNEKLCRASSLFVPNDDSEFGYNIIYSEIFEEGILA